MFELSRRGATVEAFSSRAFVRKGTSFASEFDKSVSGHSAYVSRRTTRRVSYEMMGMKEAGWIIPR